MLNDYAFGGYLVHLGQKTFIDGRGDLFERAGVLGDFVHMAKLEPGAIDILRNYDVQVCLLQHDSQFGVALRGSSNWRRVYSDGTSIILVRQPVDSSAAK